MEYRAAAIALLDPVKTMKFTAPNRFVRSATNLATASGGVAGAAEAGRIAELASGGVGTVISGAAYVSPPGRSSTRQWGLHSDERTGDVSLLAGAAHRHGAKFIVQIAHAGGQRDFADGEALSPSGLPHPGSETPTRALSVGDIAGIREDFAAAALRAKRGGADGVQVHGAHGGLLTQFMSPLLNRRNDRYGGSPENRRRILAEIYAEVRAAVGNDFPIWYKISVSEGIEGGFTEEEGLGAAIALLAAGADGIEVSSGTAYSTAGRIPSMIGVSAGESEAPFRGAAAEIKKQASPEQLIILTGGIRSLAIASGLVSDGVCDLIGMSRPLIAEPDLINRWYEEDSRPSACVSCNACGKNRARGNIDCPVLRDRNEGNWSPL